jgi:hypothetical protein
VKTDSLQPGQQVQFKLADIHLPAIEEVLNRMTEDMELQGAITLVSEQGDQKAAYVVIEVKGILMPIIVPASCVKSLPGVENLASSKSW